MFRSPRALAAVLFLLCQADPAPCRELPPLIPRDVFTNAAGRDRPSLSPDGKRLAYLAPRDGVVNLWVRSLEKSDDRSVTAEKIRVASYWWQADSEHLLYLRDQGGDENWHLFQIEAQTGLTRDLTPFAGRRAGMVALDLNFPDLVLVSLNLRRPDVRDVYRIDLKTGALTLDTVNPGNVLGWQVDRHLGVRAIEVRAEDGGRDVRLRDTKDSPWRTVEHWGVDEHLNCGVAGFSPDEKRLYLLSSRDADTLRLIELDLASGTRRVLADDPHYDPSVWCQFNPRTGALEAIQFVRDRTEWQVLDASVRGDFTSLRDVCDGDFEVVSRDVADRLWLVSYTRDDAPHSLFVYDRTTRRAQPLWNDNPTLARYRLAKIKPIAFRARDDLEIHGYLTLPVGVEPKNLPAVIYVHGGPWARHVWARQDKNMIQFLANRGYAVLQVNYRGSVGYGKRFVNAGDREAGAKMLNDVIDCKRWAVDQGYVDPKRVCIMGPSFGGYLSLAGVSFAPEEFACAVDLFGASNLVTLIRSFPIWWAKSQWHRRVGNPDTEEAFLQSRSPLFHVDRIRVPVLVFQGANDVRVPKAESDQIVAALRRAGRRVEYVVFEMEGHGEFSVANDLKLFEATERFLVETLGGRAQEASEKPKNSGRPQR